MVRTYKQYSACIRAVFALPCQAMDTTAAAGPKLSFDTHPSKYRHWTLAVEGDVARLTMKVEPFGGANTGVGGVIRDTLGTGLAAKPICR